MHILATMYKRSGNINKQVELLIYAKQVGRLVKSTEMLLVTRAQSIPGTGARRRQSLLSNVASSNVHLHPELLCSHQEVQIPIIPSLAT